MLSTPLAATAVLLSALSLVNGQTFTDCNPTTNTCRFTFNSKKYTANSIQLALQTQDMAKATPSSQISPKAHRKTGRKRLAQLLPIAPTEPSST